MGPTERIIDDNDRTFDVSLGHWAGDAVRWKQDPSIPWWSAYFELGQMQASAQETIAYPAVLIEPNGSGEFKLWFSVWNPPDNRAVTLKITDGNYAMQQIFQGFPWPYSNPLELYFNTPIDWKKKNAYTQITVQALPPKECSMYFWNPSIIQSWEPIVQQNYPQYLPIMGIG